MLALGIPEAQLTSCEGPNLPLRRPWTDQNALYEQKNLLSMGAKDRMELTKMQNKTNYKRLCPTTWLKIRSWIFDGIYIPAESVFMEQPEVFK